MVSNFRVKQWSDVRPFLDEARAFLSAREDVNAVILGISQNISRSDRPDNSDNFFALVYEGQKPVAAAFRTPPHGVALTQGPNEAMALLADAVKERYDAIPGANGPQAAVNAFSKRIASVTGQQIKVRFEMRIHRLETVEPLSVPNGQLRRAEPKDRDLLHRWMTEFSNITLERDGPTMDQVEALLAIPDPRFYFWCVGETPVSRTEAVFLGPENILPGLKTSESYYPETSVREPKPPFRFRSNFDSPNDQNK